MPSQDWKFYAQDILASIAGIERCLAGMTFEEFSANETVAKAILYDCTIIGEAARAIPPDIRTRYPEIPWELLEGVKPEPIGDAFPVNLKQVWDTIQTQFPPISASLQDILDRATVKESG